MIPEFKNPASLILLVLIPAGLVFAWRPGLFPGRPSIGHNWRGRGLLVVVTRIIIVMMLVLGLSGLRVRTRTHDIAIIFLLDVSASMQQAETRAIIDFVNAEIQNASQRDYIAIV